MFMEQVQVPQHSFVIASNTFIVAMQQGWCVPLLLLTPLSTAASAHTCLCTPFPLKAGISSSNQSLGLANSKPALKRQHQNVKN